MTSSGATIRQVLNVGQMYLGPQVHALGPDTRLVTLTAGGNDVGYVGDLMLLAYRNRKGVVGCLLKAFWKGPIPVGKRDWQTLSSDMRATLREIRLRSPKAHIIVATYPTILPTSNVCMRLGLTGEQAALMRPVGESLAEITRLAAHEAGATLVDMATLSVEHDVCSAEPWVNGPYPETGAGFAFHPTLAGAQATAHAIFRRLGEDESKSDDEASGAEINLHPFSAR